MTEIIKTLMDQGKTIGSDVDIERKELINQHFRNKTGKEIAEYLISIPPVEIGGLVALSGFYYQFMVTVEYIIQMLNGEWDFVIMEYHDDVIVGKGNKVRFVQVKSSQKITLKATESPARGLYYRTKKKIKDEKYIQANSWVDKLFSNASLSKRPEKCETEFQLYSSYHFISTQNYNIDHYTNNKFYDKKVPEDDKLLKHLSEQAFNEKGMKYCYKKDCGEDLEQLLERFYIYTGIPLNEIEKFQNHLCMKFSEVLFNAYGTNITIEPLELNFIIGYLFEECIDKNHPERLMITKDKLQDLLENLRNRTLANVSDTVQNFDSITVINKVIDELLNKVEGYGNSKKISKIIYEYRDYLENWVLKEKGNIEQLVKRLFDGTDRTSINSKLTLMSRDESLLELFTLIVMLKACESIEFQFEKNESLIAQKSENSKTLYAFLRLEVAKGICEAREKLKSIVRISSIEEQLYLLDKDLNVLVQNYHDRRFRGINIVEINLKDEIIIKEFNKDKRLNEVPLVAKLWPGKDLTDEFYVSLDKDCFKAHLSELLKEYLSEILNEGENS